MNSLLIEILIVLFLIILAGFLSAAEIAIASFGSNKIEDLKEQKDPSAALFEKIQKNTNSFFGTIQLTTNISLTAAALLTLNVCLRIFEPILKGVENIYLSTYAGIISFVISILVTSFLTLVFAILIPKALGFKYAEKLGKGSVKIFIILDGIFYYPVKAVTGFGNFLLAPFKEKTNFSQTRFSEDEIRIIISEGVKTGAIDETEQEIIENVFEFNDLRANEVMIPRTEMVAVELVDDNDDIAKEILKTKHSLIPVYQDSPDNIIGVLHVKDFMRAFIENKYVKVNSLLRPAYFIPETKLISEILREMQNRGERLAIVMDEYGGTEGVITIEDILEEIVGELGDITKTEVDEYSKLPDGTYYILGSMQIDDFNEIFNYDLPESDEYNTVAGFIADQSGKILDTGEAYKFDNLVFELIKKIRQKMVQFKVYSVENDFEENKEKDEKNHLNPENS